MMNDIINYPFDPELDTDIEEPNTGDADVSYVNGYNLPDDDEEDEDEEDDLVLGDEDELEAADLAEDEIDVEIDPDVDEAVSDEVLVLDAEDDEEEDDL